MIGTLRGDEIVALARRSIDCDHLPDAVCVIATNSDKHPAVGDLAPLFEEWLIEKAISIPDADTAIWEALRDLIAQIARGLIAPHDGLTRIMDEICDGQGLDSQKSNHLGQSHGIEHLMSDFYCRDDLLGGPHGPNGMCFNGKFGAEALVEFDKQVIQHAKSWLHDHPPDGPEQGELNRKKAGLE